MVSLYSHAIFINVRLECGRSCVRAEVGSNQRLWNWYLLLLHEAYSIKEKEQRRVRLKSE